MVAGVCEGNKGFFVEIWAVGRKGIGYESRRTDTEASED